MARSFPSLCHRIMTHCVKEEVIGRKRASKGQREKEILPSWCLSPPVFYLSSLRNVSFLSPSSSLGNFKGYPCAGSVPSFTLLFPFITSACPHLTPGMFVLQALGDEDSCLQHTLISPPCCPSPHPHPLHDPVPLLAASRGSEWLPVAHP